MAHTAVTALRCTGIRMSFGGVPVLLGVDLDLEPATVTALAGENGAGKSTLMKIMSGQYRADAGQISVDEHPMSGGNPRAATELGVAIVPQELASVPELTVYENLFVGRELRNPLGLLRRREMIRRAADDLAGFGLDIDPGLRMGALPVGIRQIIEIVKATRSGARVLLLDEPTSAIAEAEVKRLEEVVASLREQGVAVLFTTHRMNEIRAMAQRVVVLRDGALIEDSPIGDITDDEIVTAMIGRKLDNLFPPLGTPSPEPVLTVEDLAISSGTAPISLTVRKGEIVGLAGLVGAGRTELIECLYGIRRPAHGAVTMSGVRITPGRPRSSIARNVAIVPEDRKGEGAILSMSVLDNATLPRIAAFSRFGFLTQRRRSRAVDAVMTSVRLKSNGLGQLMENLSGGNQQKVVLGRWLTGEVDALLLDEPTRGVDIGARSEIYRIISELAAGGMAVLMASSDLPEILGLSHRALVMRDLTVVGELSRAELDSPDAQDAIFRLASGQESTEGRDAA